MRKFLSVFIFIFIFALCASLLSAGAEAAVAPAPAAVGAEAAVFAAGGALYGAAPSPKIYVNGSALATDVQPFILEDRVMAPLRAISEAIGCKVEWFEIAERIVIYTPVHEDPFIEMEIGYENVWITMHDYSGGSPEQWKEYAKPDVLPMIYNGRTFLPLRFIAEWMGFTVSWDENEWAVYLDNRTSDTELAQKIAGYWHGYNGVAAGYSQRYVFYPDGTYVYGVSTMLNTERELYHSGKWKVVGGRLVIIADKHLMSEYGYLDDDGADYYFADEELTIRQIENAKPVSYAVAFLGPAPYTNKEQFKIDNETYYDFNNQQDLVDFYESFASMFDVAMPDRFAESYKVTDEIRYYDEPGASIPYAGGILQKAYFYDYYTGERYLFYYVEIGQEQYKYITGKRSAPPKPIEIQVFSTAYDLEQYAGKYIEFRGEYSEAEIIPLRREVVFKINKIR